MSDETEAAGWVVDDHRRIMDMNDQLIQCLVLSNKMRDATTLYLNSLDNRVTKLEAKEEASDEDHMPKEHLRTARDVLLEAVPEGGAITRECVVSVFNEILGEKP